MSTAHSHHFNIMPLSSLTPSKHFDPPMGPKPCPTLFYSRAVPEVWLTILQFLWLALSHHTCLNLQLSHYLSLSWPPAYINTLPSIISNHNCLFFLHSNFSEYVIINLFAYFFLLPHFKLNDLKEKIQVFYILRKEIKKKNLNHRIERHRFEFYDFIVSYCISFKEIVIFISISANKWWSALHTKNIRPDLTSDHKTYFSTRTYIREEA